ncbi:hypothetical protein GGR50DRAFT_678552 [Xylaria sp. CBS 124048]|nr:hypothetical protein GGR50DRAFT_678552 [Xylaria sp. CBS 124048]
MKWKMQGLIIDFFFAACLVSWCWLVCLFACLSAYITTYTRQVPTSPTSCTLYALCLMPCVLCLMRPCCRYPGGIGR